MEKDKAHQIAVQQHAEEFFTVLKKIKSLDDLIGKDLDILLLWYQFPKSKWGNQKKIGEVK